jgi:hypothetical protein
VKKNTKCIVAFPLQQRISDLAIRLRYTYISSLVMYYRRRYAPKTEAFSFARVVDRLSALPTHHTLGDSVIRLSRHQVVYRRADSNNCIISTPITEDLRCLQDLKQQDALKRMHDRHGERKHWISSCGEMSKDGLLTWVLGQGLTCYCNVLRNVTKDLGHGRKR